MKRFLFISLVIGALGAGLALPQTKSATTGKKKTAVTTRRVKASKGKASTKTAAATAHYRQSAPTAERYKEIQQALADKGYLKSEPNGVWDNDAQEAMKQFQTDKNLPPTGKITAASLIGLGLGPKNNSAESPIPVEPPAAN